MKHVELLIERYPILSVVKKDVEMAIIKIVDCVKGGGKILLCGNGGSASDCEHISGEFLKGFLSKRKILDGEYPTIKGQAREKLQKGIAAIPLTSLTALISAFSNDVDAAYTYAQEVFALGKKGDVFIGLSTSGNAKNVINAAEVANALDMITICMAGEKESPLSNASLISIRVPETETFKVQELHLPTYHAICAQVEYELFGK
jgi:D-sedoheptulose 7-phosphate isomerase